MARPLVGPGKTSPRLYHDVLIFDPNHGLPNVLADHPSPRGEGRPRGPAIGSCQHEYATKSLQSLLPELDERPDKASVYVLAAICKKCRIHMRIRIDYSLSRFPCPTPDSPLHHFQRNPDRDHITENGITYHWQCSDEQCQAQLHICYRPPRVTRAELNLLSNTELLKSRFEYLVQRDPAREGMRQATPYEALHRLRKYIKDSLSPEHTKRSFPGNNKRFMEAFGWHGRECRPFLERLGFSLDVGLESTAYWTLPSAPAINDRRTVDGTSHREYLEDVEWELHAFMHVLSSTTGMNTSTELEEWVSANREVERVLQAQGYKRFAQPRNTIVSDEQLEYFASLGAIPDYHDDLVEFAFDRQVECDPLQSPYYVECLQVITEARGTEQLQVRTSVLASQNVISRRDLNQAYRTLGLQASSAQRMLDEQIVQHFDARLRDLGSNATDEARQALSMIGNHRGSKLLLKVSQQTLETYEDALTWLGNGMSKDSSDDEILTAFAIRTGDTPSDIEPGRKAVALIAEERRSKMLLTWLDTGRTDPQTMSVNEALRHLGVDIELEHLDQSVLPAMFESARADRPGERTDKAIATIQESLAGPRAPRHTAENWPVGLISHGNTCYLNSLLQYYFSIREFRNIVLEYKEYELDITPYGLDPSKQKDARVGGLQRKFDVIKGAQYFARDLQHLFERMITAVGPAVRPETDLVCRAFLKPDDWALLDASRRKQMTDDVVASTEMDDDPTGHKHISAGTSGSGTISMASSVTLQGSPEPVVIDSRPLTNELPPTPPDSPGREEAKTAEEALSTQAPALPPRPVATKTAESPLALAERNAREQQDVAEVHDAALDRLRIGIRPEGVDEDGEQMDGLRRLFNIEMTQTPVNDGIPGKPRPVPTTAIVVNVPEPNEVTDIYAALDDFFDLQPVEDNPSLESYKSLRGLPPLFQVSIPRASYDAESGAYFKSNGCVRLEDDLYLDRYMDGVGAEVLPLRKQCWAWRKQLQNCRRQARTMTQTKAGIDRAALLQQTAEYVDSVPEVDELLRELDVEMIGSDEELSAALKTEAEQSRTLTAALDTEVQTLEGHIKRQFEGMRQHKYRLAAVFIHRGSQGGGHYWVYIHDFQRQLWRSYNDESVDEFKQLQTMYEARGGPLNAAPPQGTPTYAVYVRDELKEQLIQPVCRKPELEPVAPAQILQQPQDAVMEGGQIQANQIVAAPEPLSMNSSTHVAAAQHIEEIHGQT